MEEVIFCLPRINCFIISRFQFTFISMQHSIVFLYTEISGYFYSCVKALTENFGVEAHVVRYPLDPNAPFKFESTEKITLYERRDFTDQQLIQLVQEIKPSIVVCSGWSDKGYMRIAKSLYGKIPTVLMFDNQWKNTIKQKVAALVSEVYLLKRFSHCWIPGYFQYEFARRLGFERNKILLGMYSADIAPFQALYQRKIDLEKPFSKKFLYVGRLLELKGVKELYEAFVQFIKETNSDWQLHIIGSGPLKAELKPHPQITFTDFVQPKELPKYIEDAGVFILPSRSDAWGVVLHECAGAGMPLISSDACGAHPTFIKPGYNGYVHLRNNVESLKQCLIKMSEKDEKELLSFSERSFELSKQLNPMIWSHTIMNLIN